MELDIVFVSVAPWAFTLFISHCSFTVGSMVGFDTSGHIAEETCHGK